MNEEKTTQSNLEVNVIAEESEPKTTETQKSEVTHEAKEQVQEKAKPKNEDVNEVILQGRIVHKFANEKSVILTIATGRATITPNYPKVVFLGETKDEAVKYEVGDSVKIVGNLQSSKPNPNIKNQMLVSVFGESIEVAKTQFEEDYGIKGNYAMAINRFKLAGTITAIDIPTSSIVRFTVRCVKNGRISFVVLIHYSKNPMAIIQSHLPGSFVRVSGSVQTQKITKGNKTNYYQNYTVTELH